MTRFKLIPWLAIPALLLLGPVAPTATAATPQASISMEDGMQYLPMDEAPAQLEGSSRLSTSAVGEVTVAQYGVADFFVANRNRFLAVRFDLPFGAPYTLTNLAFALPTRADQQGDHGWNHGDSERAQHGPVEGRVEQAEIGIAPMPRHDHRY